MAAQCGAFLARPLSWAATRAARTSEMRTPPFRLTSWLFRDTRNIYMLIGLSLAHSNGLSPRTRHRRSSQSQPNPLQLTQMVSEVYPINQVRQTHCSYPSSFEHLNPEKRPFFRKKIVVHRAPKPPNPLQLTQIYPVIYPRNHMRQTHCSYLACFQQFNLEKWPFFRKRIVVHGVGAAQKAILALCIHGRDTRATTSRLLAAAEHLA